MAAPGAFPHGRETLGLADREHAPEIEPVVRCTRSPTSTCTFARACGFCAQWVETQDETAMDEVFKEYEAKGITSEILQVWEMWDAC